MELPSRGYPRDNRWLPYSDWKRTLSFNSIASLSVLCTCVFEAHHGHVGVQTSWSHSYRYCLVNNACICLVKGSDMYNRAKHIDAWIYRIKEMSESREVNLYKVAGEIQPADIFTKSMPRSFDDDRRRDTFDARAITPSTHDVTFR